MSQIPPESSLPGQASKYDRDHQREVLQRVVAALIRRRLAAPAIFALESLKPLSYVSAQALVFLQPLVQLALPVRDYEVVAAALEDRDNIEWLIEQLEAHESGAVPPSADAGPVRSSAHQGQAESDKGDSGE